MNDLRAVNFYVGVLVFSGSKGREVEDVACYFTDDNNDALASRNGRLE